MTDPMESSMESTDTSMDEKRVKVDSQTDQKVDSQTDQKVDSSTTMTEIENPADLPNSRANFDYSADISSALLHTLPTIFQERLRPIETLARSCITQLEAKTTKSKLETDILYVLHSLDVESRLCTLMTVPVYGNQPVHWSSWQPIIQTWIQTYMPRTSHYACWQTPTEPYNRMVWACQLLLCICLDHHLSGSDKGCVEFQLLMTTITRGMDRPNNILRVQKAKQMYNVIHDTVGDKNRSKEAAIVWDAALTFAENGLVMVESNGIVWAQSLIKQSTKLFT
jgi:hypothetical protein